MNLDFNNYSEDKRVEWLKLIILAETQKVGECLSKFSYSDDVKKPLGLLQTIIDTREAMVSLDRLLDDCQRQITNVLIPPQPQQKEPDLFEGKEDG